MVRDRDDMYQFVLGSRYWNGYADRILVPEVQEAADLFWQDIYDSGSDGERFADLDTDGNRAILLAAYRRTYGDDPITQRRLLAVLHGLLLTFAFDNPNYVDPNAAPVDTRSAQEKRWAEYAEWVDARDTSMRMIEDRKRRDADFANWYRAALQSQIVSDDPMRAVNNPTPKAATVSAELRAFALEYRTMPTKTIREKLSPAYNPLGWQEFTKMRDLADQAGLI
jgi:hypothetical protein